MTARCIIGIVGGIGPESTIEYYRHLTAANAGPIVISSVDVTELLGLMMRGAFEQVTEFLAVEIERLAAAGADLALIAANTPHVVFDELARRSPVPLVSIVEAARTHVHAMGWQKVALFGTRVTMEARFYPDVFARQGITVVMPSDEERTAIHEIYVTELLKNEFVPASRARLLDIVEAMGRREGVEAVILGGTELPLLLRDAFHAGIPLLDTTRIHVRAVLEAIAAPATTFRERAVT